MTSVWRLLATALTLILFSQLAAGAGVPYLVKDINPGPGHSFPSEFTALKEGIPS